MSSPTSPLPSLSFSQSTAPIALRSSRSPYTSKELGAKVIIKEAEVETELLRFFLQNARYIFEHLPTLCLLHPQWPDHARETDLSFQKRRWNSWTTCQPQWSKWTWGFVWELAHTDPNSSCCHPCSYIVLFHLISITRWPTSQISLQLFWFRCCPHRMYSLTKSNIGFPGFQPCISFAKTKRSSKASPTWRIS